MLRVLSVLALSFFFLAGLMACGSVGVSSDDRQRATLEGEELESAKSYSRHLEQLLIGRVAGVHVEEMRGGGFRVTIRGPGSFMGDNSPLYVVDGMPMRSFRGGLQGINPRDVASIRVLKNPAETALYGVEGMNGVVLVRTIGASGKQGLTPVRDG